MRGGIAPAPVVNVGANEADVSRRLDPWDGDSRRAGRSRGMGRGRARSSAGHLLGDAVEPAAATLRAVLVAGAVASLAAPALAQGGMRGGIAPAPGFSIPITNTLRVERTTAFATLGLATNTSLASRGRSPRRRPRRRRRGVPRRPGPRPGRDARRHRARAGGETSASLAPTFTTGAGAMPPRIPPWARAGAARDATAPATVVLYGVAKQMPRR
jgi:hypothetical protein